MHFDNNDNNNNDDINNNNDDINNNNNNNIQTCSIYLDISSSLSTTTLQL